MYMSPAESGAFVLVFFIVIVIALVPYILYLLNLQKVLDLVSPDLRRMPSGQVWLLLIPLFGTIWNFIMVGHIADSLAAEFRRRNIPANEPRPGYQLGLAMAILGACGIIPYLGLLAGIGQLVVWIMYWQKMTDYKRQLEQTQSFIPPNFPPNFNNPNYPPNHPNYPPPYPNYPPNYPQNPPNYPPNNPPNYQQRY